MQNEFHPIIIKYKRGHKWEFLCISLRFFCSLLLFSFFSLPEIFSIVGMKFLYSHESISTTENCPFSFFAEVHFYKTVHNFNRE